MLAASLSTRLEADAGIDARDRYGEKVATCT
jgi:hypothetical protein